MLVGEVLWTRPVRVPGILSETSPVPGSAIATSDDQVSDAQRISCGRPAGFLSYTGGAANAGRGGMVGRTRPAAMPAPPAGSCRREGHGEWFMGDRLGGSGDEVGRASAWAGHAALRIHFMSVVAMPSMKKRWKMRNTTRIGVTTTVAPESSRP